MKSAESGLVKSESLAAASKPRMRTVTFQIEHEDYKVLQAIAARFLNGCFIGDRPMDIRDLARYALLDKKDSMAWVLDPKQDLISDVRPRRAKLMELYAEIRKEKARERGEKPPSASRLEMPRLIEISNLVRFHNGRRGSYPTKDTP